MPPTARPRAPLWGTQGCQPTARTLVSYSPWSEVMRPRFTAAQRRPGVVWQNTSIEPSCCEALTGLCRGRIRPQQLRRRRRRGGTGERRNRRRRSRIKQRGKRKLPRRPTWQGARTTMTTTKLSLSTGLLRHPADRSWGQRMKAMRMTAAVHTWMNQYIYPGYPRRKRRGWSTRWGCPREGRRHSATR